MNRQEWVANGRHINKYRRYVNNALNQWKQENAITERCAVHHRDDTEECRKYNEEHYERWGCNEDGSFEHGKYVVFMTLTEHSAYHNKGERNPWYGRHHSEETCAKISTANKGKTHSEEARAKMSANHSHYWKGKTHSEEACEKMSKSHQGKKHSEETRAKMSTKISAARTGVGVLYTTYKENGGILKWNDFCHALKNGEITFDVQPITIYTSE